MKNQERLESMERCSKFDRCSASPCPLYPLMDGIYIPGDKICPLILDYIEGKEFPLRDAVKTTESLWRKKLSEKVLEKKLASRKNLRNYWADKMPQKTKDSHLLKGGMEGR